MSWRAPTTGTPTGYVVSAQAGTRPAGAKAVDGSVLTATLTGLVAGVAHTFTVAGVDSCGLGPTGTSSAVTPTGAGSTYAAAVLSTNPVAYYRLGEAATAAGQPAIGADSSGAGRLLTYGSARSAGAGGALVGDPDTGVSLNGGCCAGSARPVLPMYDSARTVEAWVRPTDGYERWIAGWGDYEAGGAFQVGAGDATVIVSTYGDQLRFRSPRTLVDGVWHHLAVAYAGVGVTVYLDGVSLGTQDFQEPLDTLDSSDFVVGGSPLGGNPFHGSLDEVAVYRTALTAAQVVAHFAASGRSRPGAPRAVYAQPGEDNELVVSWGAATVSGGPVNRYVVTALVGGLPRNQMVVAGTKTAARMTGLAGGTPYTFRVVAGNAYGDGPAAVGSTPVAPTGPAGTYAGAVLADAPVAYHRLGEPAGNVAGGDSSGAGNLLAYRPVGTFGQPGAIAGDVDRAVRLSGTCCIGTARPANLPLYNTARTVEAWVRPIDGYQRWFVGWGASEQSGAFDVGTAGDAVHVRGYGDDVAFGTPGPLVDGLWHHIAVSYQAGAVTAYLDGLSLGSRSLRNQLNTVDTDALVVGATHAGEGPYYGGLDEVAVYPTALPAARVAAHFAASGHARPGAVTSLVATADVNQLRVSWAPPPAIADGVSSYQVTALAGGVARNSVMVSGTVSTAVLTGLPGGTAHTVRVVAANRYGAGPAVTTATAVTPSGPAGTYPSSVLASRPVAYYRLGEAGGLASAADSAGVARALTVRSDRHTWRSPGALAGDPDTAVVSDGGCCVGSARTPVPQFDTARTLQAWVKPSDGYGRWVAGWGSSGDATAFDLGLRDSTVVVHNGREELAFPTSRPLTDDVWHQVVVTYFGGSVTAYVDGLSVGTKRFAQPLNTTSDGGELWVGAGHDGGGPFYGGLDEVAVYATALPAATVAAQFAASGHARPGAVTALAATAQANAVSVSWTRPALADGVAAYRVTALVAGVPRNSVVVAGTVSTAVLTGLAGGTAYTVRVVAGNAYGDGPAATSGTPVTPSGVAGTYAATVLSHGPSAYYRLGEATGVGSGADSAGGPLLTYGPSATLADSGAVVGDPDPAVRGNGGAWLGAARPVLPQFDAARTLEAWVRPADGYHRWVAGWGTSGTRRAFNVGVAQSRIIVSGYGDDLTFPTAAPLTDGDWHHLVVTYAGGWVTVYVDGLGIGSRSFAAPLGTVDSSGLRVGAAHDGGGGFYGGLDEVAVYPIALTAAQAAAHFAASGHSRPAAVTALTVQAQPNALSVSWNATTPAVGVSHYLVTALAAGVPRNAVAVAGNALAATLTGLSGGTGYTVRVVAVNGYGDGPAALSSAPVTPSGPVTTYASAVLADGPAAYYRLGEVAGVVAGGDSAAGRSLTFGSAGELGQAGAIAGDGNTAVGANSGCCVGTSRSVLPVHDAARSVEAWVKPRDGHRRWIAGWGSGGTDRAFNVGVETARVIVSGYANDLAFTAPRPLTDGAWHHVVVSYAGGAVTAYVDGLSLGTKSLARSLNTTVRVGEGLWVGAGHDGNAPIYGGLDEVAVYPTALPAARVAAHFAASGQARPGAVGALAVTAQPNAVRVSWAAPAGAPARYLVTAVQAGVPRNAVVVTGTQSSTVLTGLAGGTAYTVRVVASNAYGDGPAATTGTPVTPSGVAGTYAATVLSHGPSAYYRLGEATGVTHGADSAGGPLLNYGTAGTLGAAGAVGGDPDTAVNANGGCCLGDAPATLPLYNSARTVEAWVKPADPYLRWIAGWGVSRTDRAFNVGVQGDGIVVSAYSDDLTFTAPSTLADGLWHHVAVTYNGTTAVAYVDGVSLGARSFAAALNTVPTGTGLQVGGGHGGGGGAYGGLDELAVYRTALSAAQVLAHYRAGTAAAAARTAGRTTS